MKHLFIINPAAGSRDQTESYRKKITEAFADSDEEYIVEVSCAPGNCKELARRAAETGEEYRIYACGGDGTLNEVVSGVAGYPNVAVTVFSGGSGNDFTRIFSEPEFEHYFGRRADKKRKFYNGKIKCDYYMFTDNARRKK